MQNDFTPTLKDTSQPRKYVYAQEIGQLLPKIFYRCKFQWHLQPNIDAPPENNLMVQEPTSNNFNFLVVRENLIE